MVHKNIGLLLLLCLLDFVPNEKETLTDVPHKEMRLRTPHEFFSFLMLKNMWNAFKINGISIISNYLLVSSEIKK
jgi:hypothetical protein